MFAKAVSGSQTAADLKGKKIGTPGKYGSSWIMLQALLGVGGPDDRRRHDRRVPGLRPGRRASQQGAVDAATGFANNEPVQLGRTGEKVAVLRIDDITPLPGPGLIVARDARDASTTRSRPSSGDAQGDGRDRGDASRTYSSKK